MLKLSTVLRWSLVLLASLLVAACGTRSVPLTANPVTTVTLPLIQPRPSPVFAPATPQPVAMTSSIALQWSEEIAAGERLPYALLCFTTQDRLSYQAWIDDLIRYIRQQNVLLDYYERSIRDARDLSDTD